MSRNLLNKYIWLLETIERHGRLSRAELNDLWYGTVWDDVHQQAAALDELIHSFNEATGVLGRL